MTNRRILRLALLGVTFCLLLTGAARAADDLWGDPRALDYPTLRPIEVPEPTRTVLSNGIVVYLLENHDFPVVDARALLRVGSIYEPAAKVGLARLTGEVMRTGGSTTVSGDSLDRVLEGLGASVEISIGDTQGSASVSTLTEDLTAGLTILADLLRNPAFPEDKLELARNSARTAIAARNDEMMNILFREFPKQVLGSDHPYARHTENSTIEAITRQDLVDFHRAYIHPDRMILTVYGDFSAAKVVPLLEKIFRGWEPAGAALPPDPEMPKTARPGLFFAHKADATNTGILIGHLGLRMDDPDYPALSLLNEVLGGGFSGRLMNEIRTKRGLAYSTFSSSGAGMHHPGSLFVSAMTQADSSAVTTGYLKAEIRKVLEAPVSDEELSRARDGILNSLVFSLSSKGAVLNRLAEYEYYGYPKDFLQRYQEAIRHLTAADLQAVAQRRIRPQEMVTLLVGNGEKVRPQLAALGEAREIDIAIPEAGAEGGAAAAASTASSASAAVPAATPADYERAQALLRRAAQATLPGKPGVLKDLTLDEAGQAFMIDQPLKVGGKTVRVLPDCEWSEQRLPFGMVTQAHCGDEAWARTPAGLRDYTEGERSAAVREADRDLLRILLDPGSVRAYALPGEVAIGVWTTDVVAVESELNPGLKLYFDRESGRVLREEYLDNSRPGGAEGLTQLEFRDYRLVQDLIWWPYLTERVIDGKPFLRMETTSVTANTSPDPAIFKRPLE